jgi:hypothetical protein
MVTKFILSCLLIITFCRVNAQEGASIYIEPPGKDTLINEVMINGKLINSTGKQLEFVKFYGTCEKNDNQWRIWITKDSMDLYKPTLVSREMEPSSYLQKDSIYRFQFCINIHNLYKYRRQNDSKNGEYLVWINYYFGEMDLSSNKLKLYFRSSKK